MKRPHEPSISRDERRMHLWVHRSAILCFAALAVAPVAAAWVQYAIAGLPRCGQGLDPASAEGPHGFPLWLRSAHYLNLLLMVFMVRSGLSILMDHPRLYWNVHCTPGLGMAPAHPDSTCPRIASGRPRTTPGTSRRGSALPGGRHTVGLAPALAFPRRAVLGRQRAGLRDPAVRHRASGGGSCPTPGTIFPEAWAVLVHYATFHMPPEPDGFYRYNSLQHLAYFGVRVRPAPALDPDRAGDVAGASTTTSGGMPGSSAIARRPARSTSSCCSATSASSPSTCSMVVITGLARNMDHIVMGTDETGIAGPGPGRASGSCVIVLACVAANWISWHRPRALQSAARRLVEGLMSVRSTRWPRAPSTPRTRSRRTSGPTARCRRRDEWLRLADDGFRDYRLRVHGLVENPVELSLDEIRALGKQEQITMHHCIQGWSGIAEWGGVPLVQARRAGQAAPRGPVRRLPLLRRGPARRRILRLPQHGQRAPSPEPPRLRDERRAARPTLRRPAAAPGREPARLQDGQVDQVGRVRRRRRGTSARATAARTRTTNTTT